MSIQRLSLLMILFIFVSCSTEDDTPSELDPRLELAPVFDELQNSIQNSAENEENIFLVVEGEIAPDIKTKLIRFIQDINQNQQNVFLYFEVNDLYSTIKQTIISHFETEDIDGTIFIGDVPIPIARFKNNQSNYYSAVSMQYYMDLDGEFEFNESDIIINHSGERTIEIWSSIIPSYGINPTLNINNYFDKNHSYRNGEMMIQQGFINSIIGSKIEDKNLYDYQYDILLLENYIDLNQRGNLFLGIDNKIGDFELFPNAKQGYEVELLTDKYDVAKIGAHGSSTEFGSFDEWGSIIVDIDYAKNYDIKPMLLIETSCNSAAIDKESVLACEFLYNPTNNVVTYSGATAAQGGQGATSFGKSSNFRAEKLMSGSFIGEALFAPMYHKYESSFELNRGYFSTQQIVLGDGSLRLQEFMK